MGEWWNHRGKRSKVLIVVVGLFVVLAIMGGCNTASPAVDAAKFDDAWRAYKAIDGATMVGVTLLQLQPLVQDFATELSLLSDQKLSLAEQEVQKKLVAVLQAYADSVDMWALQIRHSSSGTRFKDTYPLYFEDKPLLVRSDAIVETYGLTTEAGELSSTVVPANSLRVIWKWAGEKAAEVQVLRTAE